MSARSHPLFTRAPLSGDVSLPSGPAPVPYHVYAGHGTIVLGTCEADRLNASFEGQDVFPVLTRSGKGVLVIFICDFVEASLGPHSELHVAALASAHPGEVLPDDPAAALAALPGSGVLSLHLWNSDARVVAYNSDYLGLQAELATSSLAMSETTCEVTFSTQDGDPLLTADLAPAKRSDAGLMMRVMRHLGVRGLWQAMRNKTLQAFVINRKCAVLPRNGWARTLTAPDKMVVNAFDPARHSFSADKGPLSALGFTPQIIEHVFPFRFIYLHPDDPAP